MSAPGGAPDWWFSSRRPPAWASCLAAVLAPLAALRRLLYRRGLLRSRHPGVPVVVVGNIVAGGSGKTPLVQALVERLVAAGYHPGIASRGHGRQLPRVPRWVEAGSDAALVGDEPLLLAKTTGVPVRVDRDRAAAARALAATGCDVIVCDDGLQHYGLARDVEIEVQDAGRRYGNGRLLPAGPLREPVARALACDLRVLNLGVSPPPAPAVPGPRGQWSMWLEASAAEPLVEARAVPLGEWVGRRVHAVAGIGEPERFFATLRAAGIDAVPHPFPDHHAFVAADLAFPDGLPVLMTQKDAVKCTAFAQPGWYCVPVRARLPEAFWQRLLALLPQPQA